MSEVWLSMQTNFVELILALIRITGLFSFNPIFGRNNVPAFVRTAMCFVFALVMVASGSVDYTMPAGILPFVFDIFKEMLVGLVLGFFVNVMLQIFSLAGELSDMQIGLSMARGYDPTFGSAGLSTQFYSYWFMLYFFAVGGHLSYIELFFVSFETIPMGFDNFNINIGYIIVQYFQTVLTLGVKLAMPIVAASLVTEFCIGVLMKAVPTIHVFVINIQIKMLVGLVVLAASCGVISEFMGEVMGLLFHNLNGLMGQMTVS